MTPQTAPVSGRPLTAEDVEIIRDYWSAYADADWHLIPEAIRDDFDARLVAVGLAEWRAVTADDLDDAFAHDRGLEAGGSCLDLTALGYLAFKADADGWMPWSGGENPVPGQRVEARCRDGHLLRDLSDVMWWSHSSHPEDQHADIIAFRPVGVISSAELIANTDYARGAVRVPGETEDRRIYGQPDQPVEAIGAGREEEIPERAEGRLAERPWRVGDPLPAVGSVVLVSGVHGDIESDQHRGYLRRTVIGYGKDNAFICLQTEGCWPTVERTTNCWFAALSPASPARTPMGGRPSDEQVRRAIQTRLHLHPTDETLGCLDRAVADIQALFAPPSVQPVEGK